jgi:hypothetical protein
VNTTRRRRSGHHPITPRPPTPPPRASLEVSDPDEDTDFYNDRRHTL